MDPLKVSPSPESKLHFLDYWRIIRIRKTVILAVFLLVVITATVVTLILPESYMSEARIMVSRDQADIAGLTERPGANAVYDPYFIQTEFESIKSEVILDKVIEALDLNTRWGKKYAGDQKLKTSETRSFLKRSMDLVPVRNTSFIQIRVYNENKQEAADIANKIAEVYHKYRQDQGMELAGKGIKALIDQKEQHEAKVKVVQDQLEKLRQDLDISEMEAAGTGPSTTIDIIRLQNMQAQLMEAEARYTKEQTLIDKLTPLNREELKRALPTTIPDQLLVTYLTDLAQFESRQVAVRKDYGSEHPEVQRSQALVDDHNKKVNERLDGIMFGLNAQVSSTKAALDKLRTAMEDARKKDQERATRSQKFWDKKRELENMLRVGQTLDMKLAFEKVDLNLPRSAMVRIMDRAEPGLRPVKPNKTLNIALGIIIGLVVGVGLAFFIEYLDTSVKTIDDVERALQSPVLGVIPQNVGLLMDEGAESPHAEAYRVLRTNLLFSRKDDKLNTACIVSAGAGEGKSTTVVNLAAVFAQAGQRVLIVDSDLRRPTLHKLFRVANNLGLTNYLLKQNTLEQVIQTTSLPSLDFLASGKLPSSSLGILSSSQMKDLIAELKQRYDFVFFDSPPIMGVSDASILASEVDMTLQVIQYRRYPQPMNIRAKQLIEKVGGNLIGIVLNNINMAQDESYYYYSGYYHEYYSRSEDSVEPAGGAKTPEGAPEKKTKLDIKQKY